MEYLCDHPLLLSLPFHDSIETLGAVRTLSSFFLRQVNERVRELALALGVQRPVRHYKDLIYEYARIRFTPFLIPELKELWIKHAVRENKVEELRESNLEYRARDIIHATSPEMFIFLKTNPHYSAVFTPCPFRSLEATLFRLESNVKMRMPALIEYIKKDNVEEIQALAGAFGLNPLDVPNLYTVIGPNLFKALGGDIPPPPPDVRSLQVRCHLVAIHFIENGTIPDLKQWVRAGVKNVELMKYLFEKGVDKNCVHSLLEDVIDSCNSELLLATLAYLQLESLAGKECLLERNPSREYIHLLHSLGSRVCKYSLMDLVEACCRDKRDDPAFLQEMLALYGIEIVHALNREWFGYEVIPTLIEKSNLRILAFCIKHRIDYTQEELTTHYDEDDDLELDFDDYDLRKLSAYQREKLDFYLAQNLFPSIVKAHSS